MANVKAVYGYTGFQQRFTVPLGVTQVIVEAWGGWGGSAFSEQDFGTGGPPGYCKGTRTVVPGDNYFVYAAGAGSTGQITDEGTSPGAGGYGNGGAGGASNTYFPGGGGGGASDFRGPNSATAASRILVAAGGGGAGTDLAYSPVTVHFPTSPYPPYAADPTVNHYYSSGSSYGGPSGTQGGWGYHDTSGGAQSQVSGSNGKGGTLSAGGAGGTAVDGSAPNGGTGTSAGAGGAGGGNAASISSLGGVSTAGGGGGGGGYYGGGGGACTTDNASGTNCSGGGGGGGSNFIDGSFAGIVNTIACRGNSTGNAPSGGSLNGAVVVSYVQPPNTPTPTIGTPNTGTANQYDVSQPIEVDFAFSHLVTGETQSRFDIQYSTNGGSTWTTITNPGSSAQDYIFAGGFFAGGVAVEVEVRVYDHEGTVSAWSAPITFTPVAILAAPTITAPAGGSTVTSSTFTATWTIPSGTQNAYQVQVIQADGNLLYDSGVVASSSQTLVVPLASAISETDTLLIRYKTTTSGGIFSTAATRSIFINLSPPGTPTVVLTPSSANGTVTLAITNPGTPNLTVSNDIYRTNLTEGGAEIRIATGLAPSATFIDYSCRSGSTYAYRVRAYSAAGGVADAT